MDVPRERLGLDGEGETDILDVKLAPLSDNAVKPLASALNLTHKLCLY